MTLTPEGATFTAINHGCDPCRSGLHQQCKKAVDIFDQEHQPGGGDEGYLPSPRCVCYDQNRDEHAALVNRAQGEEIVPTKQRPGDQRLPLISDEEDIQSRVIRDIEKRRQVGIERYGTALQPFNGRSTLLDAYEESLDKTVYLKSLLVMRDAMRGDLIDAATRAITKQWYENAEQKIEDSPEGFSAQLAEIAVDAILDAFAENSPVVRQG